MNVLKKVKKIVVFRNTLIVIGLIVALLFTILATGLTIHDIIEKTAKKRVIEVLNTYIEAYKEKDINKLAGTFYPENSPKYKDFIEKNEYMFYTYPIILTKQTKINAISVWINRNEASSDFQFIYLDDNNYKLCENYNIPFVKVNSKWYLKSDFYLFDHQIIIKHDYNTHPPIVIEDKDALHYTIEDNEHVDYNTFDRCNKLLEISFPKQYKSIDANWFYHCQNLIEVNIAEDSPFMKSIDGIVYSKDGSMLLYYPRGKIPNQEGVFYVPDHVTTINHNAFLHSSGIRKIVFSDSVRYINNNAFTNSINLEEVSLNDGLLYIMNGAFKDCQKLREITLPDSVIHIGNECFYNCRTLTTSTIPDTSNLTHIGYGAFEKCRNLTSINIPSGITKIDNWTFQDCYNLIEISLSDNLEHIGMFAFRNCASLKDLYISKNVNYIDKGAFSYCAQLTLNISHNSKPKNWHSLWDLEYNNDINWS